MPEENTAELLRTFIAVPLTEAVQQQVQRTLDTLRPVLPSVRWVKPEHMHLTLQFLGDVPSEKLPAVLESATALAGQFVPFTVEIGGLGVFPHPARPRVIWLGVRSPGHVLERLAQQLSAALSDAGWAAEIRPFSPHLTLSRIKAPLHPAELGSLQALLSKHETARTVELLVNAIVVLRSELLSRGPRYTVLRECTFVGGTRGEPEP